MSDRTWFPYGPGLDGTIPGFGDRPHADVWLEHQRSRAWCQPIPILIDSGADSASFPVGMADRLGITLDGVPITTNRFGRQYAPNLNVRAKIADTIVTLRPRFCIDRPVLCLGRYDLFAHFRVTFDELGQRVGLAPYPKYRRGKHPHPAPASGVWEPLEPPDWLTRSDEGDA